MSPEDELEHAVQKLVHEFKVGIVGEKAMNKRIIKMVKAGGK